jgi:hypothetical protein
MIGFPRHFIDAVHVELTVFGRSMTTRHYIMMRSDPQAVPLRHQAITLQFKKYSASGRFRLIHGCCVSWRGSLIRCCQTLENPSANALTVSAKQEGDTSIRRGGPLLVEQSTVQVGRLHAALIEQVFGALLIREQRLPWRIELRYEYWGSRFFV